MRRTNPRFSIITTTYNHEKYIDECINSVISQTYQKWELIVMDDASNDSTKILLKKYLKDKRIKLIQHKHNFGINRLAESYNEALGEAVGEYVCILEGDDYWPKDKLELQNRLLKKETVMLYGDWVMVDKNSLPIFLGHYDKWPRKLLNNHKGRLKELFWTLRFNIISSTVAIRRNALIEIGGFIKSNKYPFVDFPTYFALIPKGNFQYENHILGYYRKHDASSWLKTALVSRNMLKTQILSLLREYFPSNNSSTIIWSWVYLKWRGLIFPVSNYISKAVTATSRNFLQKLTVKILRVIFLASFYRYKSSKKDSFASNTG